MKTFFYFKENVSFLVYSVAFGTFSGSPLPGGEMEGDGAGCLRCVTGYNGNFCTFSFLFALERVRERRKREVTLFSVLRRLEGGGACLDQMLCPAVFSPFFEAA